MPSTLMRPSQIAKIPFPFNVASIFKSDVNEVNVNNTTTETPLQNYTIPAGALGPNDQIDFFFSAVLSNNSGASANFTHRVKFGGVILLADTVTIATASTNIPYYVWGNITNRGRNDFQISTVSRFYTATGITSMANALFSVDSTGAVVLQMTIQLGTAAATISSISNTAIVTLKPGT